MSDCQNMCLGHLSDQPRADITSAILGQCYRREEGEYHGLRHPLEEALQVPHLDELPRVALIC